MPDFITDSGFFRYLDILTLSIGVFRAFFIMQMSKKVGHLRYMFGNKCIDLEFDVHLKGIIKVLFKQNLVSKKTRFYMFELILRYELII